MAVYQRALKLLYVDELLERVKREFSQQYKPDQVAQAVKVLLRLQQGYSCSADSHCLLANSVAMQFKYKNFEESFRQMLKDAENSVDISKHSAQAMSSTKVIRLSFNLHSYLEDATAASSATKRLAYCCIGFQPKTGQQGRWHHTDKQQG